MSSQFQERAPEHSDTIDLQSNPHFDPTRMIDLASESISVENPTPKTNLLLGNKYVIGGALVLLGGAGTYIGMNGSRVNGKSMEPTIHNDDRLLTIPFAKCERFDFVSFPHFEKEHGTFDSNYIKRVVGMPGETLEYTHGKLIIDGKVIPEPIIRPSSLSVGPVTIEHDRIYVMGDNTLVSSDSREIGTVYIGDVTVQEHFCFHFLR